MKLAAYIPLLMKDFPDAAFTADSLSFVARRAVKGFPTYAEVCIWLGDWWRSHGPRPLALPGEPVVMLRGDPPTQEEIEHVRRVAAETIAVLRANAIQANDWEPTARHLTPAQLDALNPLPNGRRRVAAS